MRHIEQVDVEMLLREMRQDGDLSVLGVLCDAARACNPHAKFDQIIRACKRADKLEPFFRRVAKSRVALTLAQENAVDVFRRWNYLCGELSYL